MNKILKLLKKISNSDQVGLLQMIEDLINGNKKIQVLKIINSDFYRVKYKSYRIIFHYQGNQIVIDAIKLRNENTYKNI